MPSLVRVLFVLTCGLPAACKRDEAQKDHAHGTSAPDKQAAPGDKQAAPGDKPGSAKPDRYTVRAKFTEIPASGDVMVHHEKIPAFRAVDGAVRDMASMVMPFALGPGVARPDLSVGAPFELDVEVHWDAPTALVIVAARPLAADTRLAID